MSANQGSSDTPGIESVVSNSVQEPSSDARTASIGKHRCIVVSLIRHAESRGNINASWEADDAPTPLTETGRSQADSLGRVWSDTRIDCLLSSPLQRAHDTAKALAGHNEGHPEIVVHPDLVERRYGGKVYRLMQWNRSAAREELTGKAMYGRGPLSRSHCPGDGGESMNMVAWRAEAIIRLILSKYGVDLSDAPEFFVEKKETLTAAVLPDGVPHVVIVSHNVFLMELYEKLHSWGREHLETDCDWRNAGWSRHILWYDEDSDTLDVVDMKFCG